MTYIFVAVKDKKHDKQKKQARSFGLLSSPVFLHQRIENLRRVGDYLDARVSDDTSTHVADYDAFFFDSSLTFSNCPELDSDHLPDRWRGRVPNQPLDLVN